MENFGEKFIHQKDSKLHTTKPVEHELERRKKIKKKSPEEAENLNISQKPFDKLGNWFEVLEKTHMGHNDDPRVLERIKNYYHKEHVIKPEDIPESVFELEQAIARNQGHGDIEITEEFKEAKKKEIISNQERSLDKWIDYLTSDDATYPMWAKYWAFNSMLKMGKLEKKENEETGEETMRFRKREKQTAAPFPIINPRALAMTISAISSKAEQNSKNKNERITPDNLSTKLSKEEFNNLLNSESFSKLYSQFLIEMPEYSTEGLRETRGEWKTYKKGSEPDELVESLDGHPLEWCTANINTARTQLQGGDFYVYYSINEKNDPVIPRVAIRMERNNIAEVRGIASDQNIDPYIGDVVKEKMNEFPDGEKYQKKTEDMKRLTEIEEKNNRQEELSKDDLKFLYEIDDKIQGFGYHKDPRIEEIIGERDIKKDLSIATGHREDEISLTELEVLNGGIKYHYGDLDLPNLTPEESQSLPDTIGGNLRLGGLTSAEGLNLPKEVGGSLHLENLTSAEGLNLPNKVGGDLDLRKLTSAEGLNLPKEVGGSLRLGSLTSAEDLNLPNKVGGYLNLSSLTSAEGLNLPNKVGGDLDLLDLASAEGLNLPKEVGGNLGLGGFTSAEGLNLPDKVGGNLIFLHLTSAEGLNLPKEVGGNLRLGGLTSAEGLNLPKEVGGSLHLENLTSAEGLNLPNKVGGDLDLRKLTSAEGLNLPNEIGGNLNLIRLASAEGLNLPDKLGGGIDLGSLTSAKDLNLPNEIRGTLNLGDLTSAEGLNLPNKVGGDLMFFNLTSAEGLNLPTEVGRSLYLGSFTSAKGLKLPNTIGRNLYLSDLTSAKGLNLPDKVGGDIYLKALPLTDIEKIKDKYPQFVDKIESSFI